MTLHIKKHYAQHYDGSQWVEPRHGGWFEVPPSDPVDVSVNTSATLETLMEASGYNKWRGSMEQWQDWVNEHGYVYTEGGVKQCCMDNCVEEFGNDDMAEFVYKGQMLERGSALTDFGVHDGAEIDMYHAGYFCDQSINEH